MARRWHWRSLGAIIGVSAVALIGASPAVAKPSLRVLDAAAAESEILEFSVRLSPSAKKTVTVDYEAEDGTAGGDDYEETSGTLRFKKGKTRKTVRVPLIDDSLNEAEETLNVQLSSAHRARIGDGIGAGSIADDDEPTYVDFCKIQFPVTAMVAPSSTTTVYGRVYEPGMTNLAEANHPSITSGVGYGPDGTDPRTAPGWTFFPASPNPTYGSSSPGYLINEDEHQGNLVAPEAPGSYDYAFRFSLDGGLSYSYCDTVDADYTPVQAGQMTVTD